jgi:hypothetical protein
MPEPIAMKALAAKSAAQKISSHYARIAQIAPGCWPLAQSEELTAVNDQPTQTPASNTCSPNH